MECFPEVKQTRYLGWPSFKLFREGYMAAIGHLFRYTTMIRLMSQTEEYALRNFPFSLAVNSCAFKWFATLPKQSIIYWTDLVEAFMARFHDYTIRVNSSQVQAVRPLSCETSFEFIMRWMDTRLHCPHLHPAEKPLLAALISLLTSSSI